MNEHNVVCFKCKTSDPKENFKLVGKSLSRFKAIYKGDISADSPICSKCSAELIQRFKQGKNEYRLNSSTERSSQSLQQSTQSLQRSSQSVQQSSQSLQPSSQSLQSDSTLNVNSQSLERYVPNLVSVRPVCLQKVMFLPTYCYTLIFFYSKTWC